MSKSENTRSCGCQGHQEQDRLFQPEHDGSLSIGPGGFLETRSFPFGVVTDNPCATAKQQVRQE